MSDFQHIESWARAQERPDLRRFDEAAVRVQSRYAPELTDFLTPREQKLALSMGKYHQLQVSFWGGHPDVERKRALFAPDYWNFTESDFDVVLLQGEIPANAQVGHKDVMGSLLGTGVKRSKIGDIALDGQVVYVAADTKISEYVLLHWHQVGKSEIHLNRFAGSLTWPQSEYKVVEGTVASLRLDAVVAQFCKWPRARAQAVVSKGKVKLNFAEITRMDEPLEEGDVLSVQGFGRLQLMRLEGQSRKGKLRVRMGVLKS